ncbi:metal ABC transporter permease [Vibrio sp. JC009]|uniref:metal ABC transporter permease n=1 Tax=Vibrio sp. JC009 TaxID=2912314 RepID=UPI0023B047BA|nr:metal ABC transporter permease [Vibrio sp. JC009]WED24688.1 metal ABC transporter permease [Vibrio sp. JC009]
MNEFITALTNPDVAFIRYAFLAGLLSSIPFGIIGSFVVVKRMTYIAGAVSHTSLGGIGLALYLSTVMSISSISPMGGAVIFALISALIISLAITKTNARLDTVIGSIWAIGMSLGLIFIYLTPGYIDPMSYLFGNILLISRDNLITILTLSSVITLFSLLFFNQFISTSFDSDFARTRNINTTFYETFLIILVALTVILMINIVGIVMVIALLTLPPAISALYTKRMKSMMLVSILVCALITSSGLYLSYIFTVPTGSTTVILGGVIYVTMLLSNKTVNTLQRLYQRKTA